MLQTPPDLNVRRCSVVERLFLCLCIACCTSVYGELPTPRLDTVFPPGAAIGSQAECTVSGGDLEDLTQWDCVEKGIQAVRIGDEGSMRFRVTVSTNVAPGLYPIRVRGRLGLSNPRFFQVGWMDEILSHGTNRQANLPQQVPLNCTLSGRVAAAKTDYYAFNVRGGQRIFVECAAAEVDSRLDPSLVAFGPGHRELARRRRGGFMEFLAPKDGQYSIGVYDLLNRGGDEYVYRLTISDKPHVYGSDVCAVSPTNRSRLLLLGRNLNGGTPSAGRMLFGQPLEEIPWDATSGMDPLEATRPYTVERLGPASFGCDLLGGRPLLDGKWGDPLLLGVASVPVVSEKEPNDGAGAAQRLELPIEVDGDFSHRMDRDWYEFEGKKGQTWILEVISQRMGFRTDPTLSIGRVSKNAKGVEQWADVADAYDLDPGSPGPDFKSWTGDPTLRFDVPQDGLYRILIRDESEVPNDSAWRRYRLIVRPPSPGFRLAVIPQPPPVNKDSKEVKRGTETLRGGGVTPIRVMSFRSDGFDGPIEVRVEGLPDGVSASRAVLSNPEMRSATVFLKARAGAPSWTGPIRVLGVAKGTSDRGPLEKEARAATLVWPVGNVDTEAVQTRMVDAIWVSVLGQEPAPMELEFESEGPVSVVAGAKVSIPFRIRRAADFNANTKVRLMGPAALGAGKEIDVDKAATNAVVELDLSQLKIPEGEHALHLEAPATFQAFRSVEGAKQADVAKQDADKALAQAKEALASAQKSLSGETEALQKLEKEAKATPDKAAQIPVAQEQKNAASKRVEASNKQVADAEQAVKNVVERQKRYAKREFNEVFYSLPITLRVTSPASASAKGRP